MSYPLGSQLGLKEWSDNCLFGTLFATQYGSFIYQKCKFSLKGEIFWNFDSNSSTGNSNNSNSNSSNSNKAAKVTLATATATTVIVTAAIATKQQK